MVTEGQAGEPPQRWLNQLLLDGHELMPDEKGTALKLVQSFVLPCSCWELKVSLVVDCNLVGLHIDTSDPR